MKTKKITIELEVPADITDHQVNILKAKCGMLADPDFIASFWSVEDVFSVAPNIMHEEAQEVLAEVDRRHDATIGINWDVLQSVAERLFPASTEDTED